MAEKIASLYAEIGADTKGLETGLANTKTGIAGVIGSFTEMASALSLAQSAIGAAGAAYDAFVTPTLELASAQRELAAAGQITVEEAGTLIQVADDLKISTGSLSAAFREMTKEGLQPTFANIKDLARQFQAIQDPTERLAFAQKNLGRSYQELLPLLQKTPAELDAMAKSVQFAGNVMSTQGVEDALKYEQAVDGLSDSWQAFTVTVGQKAIPALTAGLESMNAQTERMNLLKEALSSGVISQNEFNLAVNGTHAGVTNLGLSTDELTHRLEAQAAMTDLETARLEMYKQSAAGVAESTMTARQGLDLLNGVFSDAASSGAELLGTLDSVKSAMAFSEGIEQGLGQQVAGALEQAGLKASALYDALGLVDDEFGTGAQKSEEMRQAIEKAVAEFKKTGDLDTFKEHLKDINLEFGSTFVQASAASGAMKDLYANLNALPDSKTIDLIINYGTNTEQQDLAGLLNGRKRAGGGEVNAGEPYLVGENGPEVVVPDSNGTVIPNDQLSSNGGGLFAGATIVVRSELDIEMLARKVAAYTNGAYYAAV